jgi:hypothetical protein
MKLRSLITVTLLTLPGVLSAHSGGGLEPPEEPAQASALQSQVDVPAKPHLLADGQLYVPKAVQHLLGVRTEILGAAPAVTRQIVTGEIVADPNSHGHITAQQSGRLEASEKGWPLPGAKIEAGETLAYLVPVMTAREQAQRRAVLAQVNEDMQISEINVERLKLQAEANGTLENAGNVYYEQALLELNGLKDKYRLESEALTSRVAVRADVAGVLTAANVRPGQIVTEAQALFEVADRTHLRIALPTFDSTLATRLRSARWVDDQSGAAPQTLKLQGQEPLDAQQGWRLLFDAVPSQKVTRTPGEIVTLALELSSAETQPIPSIACVAGASGNAVAWVHVSAERFERRRLSACEFDHSDNPADIFKPGERVVTQAAALLSEYR